MQGGNPSKNYAQHPWHMVIFTYAEYPTFKDIANDHVNQSISRCGGALISVKHILTAASCVEVLWKVPLVNFTSFIYYFI